MCLRGRVGKLPLILPVLLMASLAAGIAAGGQGPGAEDEPETSYERPDPEVVRSQVDDILSRPEYSSGRSFATWLREKLSDWSADEFDLPEWVVTLLFWTLIAWCVITLLAILGHLAWTLTVMLAGSAPVPWFRRGDETTETEGQPRTHEYFHRRRANMAENGEFRRALAFTVLSLLLRLDRAGLLSYHDSKTNGDYVGELPEDFPLCSETRDLLLAADRSLYGPAACDRHTYDRLDSSYMRIMRRIDEWQ